MSDEVLREMCDKNSHQLLPFIAKKMQKEKEQKDKLNVVKARLIYGDESGIKIRIREESHYFESNTPTARTEPEEDTEIGASYIRTFDKLPKESIDSYEDLRTAFRENYLQQTKHIKDPVEIHHIKQRDGESTEDFMERYKAEVLDVEGAPECMRISGFMHGITHPGLIKRLYERISRSMDEMYRMATSFLQGEVIGFSHSRRKASLSWKQSERGTNRISRKGSEQILRISFRYETQHERMHAPKKANRRNDQGRKIVPIHQGIKTERQAESTEKRGSVQKG
ncbi:reverse transcriptase domain-containing protein [Tanacetum coccineum]